MKTRIEQWGAWVRTDAPPALVALDRDGARALGLDAEIGSLEVGKRADVIVVRTDGAHQEPGGDVFSRLVYATKSSDVEHVIIDGELIVKHREHTRFDSEAVRAHARDQAQKLTSRARV